MGTGAMTRALVAAVAIVMRVGAMRASAGVLGPGMSATAVTSASASVVASGMPAMAAASASTSGASKIGVQVRQ